MRIRTPFSLVPVLGLALAGCGEAVHRAEGEEERSHPATMMAAEGGTMLTEIIDQSDGGLPAIVWDDSEPFSLEDLTYPVEVVSKDQDGNVVGRRLLATEEEVWDDWVLDAAEVRSDLLRGLETDYEGVASFIRLARDELATIPEPDDDPEGTALLIATIRDISLDRGEGEDG